MFNPWVRKIPWRRKWPPTPAFLPGKSHRQRSLAVYSPWVHKRVVDNHNDVITHLKSDILECKVKWALGSITMNKATGADGILVELFQILKDDGCYENAALHMPANLENSAVTTGLEKISFPSNPKGNDKECSNYRTIALISHASKVMLKILQGRLQHYMNRELPDVKLDLEKAEEPEIKLPTSIGS